MQQKVILLCGVPGSGKTYVASQLTSKYNYQEQDDIHPNEFYDKIIYEASMGNKPVLLTCPFNERAIREKLEHKGLEVVPVFIVETPEVVKERYYKREGKYPKPNVVTRATTIMNKVKEWDASFGTSEAILEYLKALSF